MNLKRFLHSLSTWELKIDNLVFYPIFSQETGFSYWWTNRIEFPWSPRTDLNRQPADYKSKIDNFHNPLIFGLVSREFLPTCWCKIQSFFSLNTVFNVFISQITLGNLIIDSNKVIHPRKLNRPWEGEQRAPGPACGGKAGLPKDGPSVSSAFSLYRL